MSEPTADWIKVEVRKVSVRQSADGLLITFAVDPNQHPDEVMRLIQPHVGTIFMAALCELNPDSTLKQKRAKPGEVVAFDSYHATMREPAFWRWAASRGFVSRPTQADAEAWVKKELGINSSSELKTDEIAREKWKGIRSDFQKQRR